MVRFNARETRSEPVPSRVALTLIERQVLQAERQGRLQDVLHNRQGDVTNADALTWLRQAQHGGFTFVDGDGNLS